jgi:hypothetical protein
LAEKIYDHEAAKEWSKGLTDNIKGKVKESTNPRYKIAVQIHIGSMEGQGMFAASLDVCGTRRQTITSPTRTITTPCTRLP